MSTVPTLDDLARAWGYISHEFKTEDGSWISSEMWAEGLAFGRYRGGSEDYYQAREAQGQLTPAEWAIIGARAEYMRACDGFAYFDRKAS